MVLFQKINKELKNKVDHSEKLKLQFFKRDRKTKINDLKLFIVVCSQSEL
jgi:hypothetical protein